ncbi:MAG: putative transcriptional regulator with C-terminal CBS domain [Promethearchaeota archaeon]|nr:MAG: putative transcriptional regulator with C-terminal CBS domain [Candidatus Lokiarchaeota archaeon]
MYEDSKLKIVNLPDQKAIKVMRKKLKISQKTLGEKTEIPQSTISRIESNAIDPPYSKFKKIYEFLAQENEKKKEKKVRASNIMSKNVYKIDSQSKIKDAIELMNKHKISQVPILENGQNLGSLTSKRIQMHITDNPDLINLNVLDLKELPFPEVEKNWRVKEISNLLITYPAVLVKAHNKYIGIITDADVLKYTEGK